MTNEQFKKIVSEKEAKTKRTLSEQEKDDLFYTLNSQIKLYVK